MSKKNYSKTVDRMTLTTLLMLVLSVALLISDRFVDGGLSTFLLVVGLVGLVAFIFMVFKTGRMMDAEDAEKHNITVNVYDNSYTARDPFLRSTMEDDSQYKM